MIRTVSLLSGLMLLLSYPAAGQEAAASREASSQLSGSQLGTLKQQTSQSDLAQEWGLNQQEWTRYQTLMQGPRGAYSPGIDPLTALGIEARSAEERRRYADLQVQAERRRVEGTRLPARIRRSLRPRLSRRGVIRLTESSTANPSGTPNMSPALQSSGRLALFVQDNCTACIQRVRDLQHAEKEFDLYFVGSQNDAEQGRGAGQSSPASTRRRFAASRSRSIMTRAAGWP
ncbi:TIGR03759 family integrating conjugative element protein [Pseudomonas aeruginosa]|nr:TIGR03759 family integrating conjugative element protein [Pseudomonas aeruginosa]